VYTSTSTYYERREVELDNRYTISGGRRSVLHVCASTVLAKKKQRICGTRYKAANKQPQTTQCPSAGNSLRFAPVHQGYSSCCIPAFLPDKAFRPFTTLYELARRLFESISVLSSLSSPFQYIHLVASRPLISSHLSTFQPIFALFSKVRVFGAS